MAYRVGDLIWAKMKGYPHWPARIDLVAPGIKIPKKKFPIFFYGTHETAFMQAKDLCPYKENKSKYYVTKRVRGFQEGLDEIEKTPLIKYGDKKDDDDESSNEEEERKDVKLKDKVKKQEKKEIPKNEAIEKDVSPATRPSTRKSSQENKEVEQIQEEPLAKKPKVSFKESPKAEVVSPRKRGRKPKQPVEEIENVVEENVEEKLVEEKEGSVEGENEKIQHNDTEDQMSKEEFLKKQLERHQKKKELMKEKKRQEKLEQKKAERLAAEREKELIKRMPTTEQILEKFLYDLKMSLTVEAPDISRCIRIMGQIQNLDITPDMVQNSTDLITTIKRIRKYKGSDKVADRANELYRKLKSFFEVSTAGVNGGDDDDETDDKSSNEEHEKPSTEENETTSSESNARQTREKSQRVKRLRRCQNNGAHETENNTVNGASSESQEESLPT